MDPPNPNNPDPATSDNYDVTNELSFLENLAEQIAVQQSLVTSPPPTPNIAGHSGSLTAASNTLGRSSASSQTVPSSSNATTLRNLANPSSVMLRIRGRSMNPTNPNDWNQAVVNEVAWQIANEFGRSRSLSVPRHSSIPNAVSNVLPRSNNNATITTPTIGSNVSAPTQVAGSSVNSTNSNILSRFVDITPNNNTMRARNRQYNVDNRRNSMILTPSTVNISAFVPTSSNNANISQTAAGSSNVNVTQITGRTSTVTSNAERLRNIDPEMVEMIENEIVRDTTPVDWNSIAGLAQVKTTIKEAVVLPLLRPDIFTGLRGPPRGILLFGPPGNGKTLIGKCIATQSNSTFFSISASAILSKWIGEAEKTVRALFAVAATKQPAVIFIDEVDSLLSARNQREHESTRSIKTEFLIQLDGIGTAETDRILIIGATNRPQDLDEAARRRFVKRLYIQLPDLAARIQIIQELLQNVRHNITNQQFREIGQLTNGFSGADMKTLCQTASMGPIRAIPFDQMSNFNADNLRLVSRQDFRNALANQRPSVSQADLQQHINFNRTYGSQ